MITPDVSEQERELIKLRWEIVEVEPVECYHKYKKQFQQVNLYPEEVQLDMMRWKHACTKFAAWKFIEYDRIIFMDSDTIVLNSIDDAINYSNASLVAAPECFPPDTFNSGFLVLTPSIKTFNHLVDIGNKYGSAEGGDQGMLNNYYCSNWFKANDDDPLCGKLPWTYNVEAQYYETYKNYRLLYDMEPMKVIHYINDGKPWKTLMFDYNIDKIPKTPMIETLSSESYVASHMYWRYCFLRATKLSPPLKSIYYDKFEDVINKKGIFEKLSEPFFDQITNSKSNDSIENQSNEEIEEEIEEEEIKPKKNLNKKKFKSSSKSKITKNSKSSKKKPYLNNNRQKKNKNKKNRN